jgi:hypothetical protein
MRAYRNHWANDVFCTPWRHRDPLPQVLDDPSQAADDGKEAR